MSSHKPVPLMEAVRRINLVSPVTVTPRRVRTMIKRGVLSTNRQGEITGRKLAQVIATYKQLAVAYEDTIIDAGEVRALWGSFPDLAPRPDDVKRLHTTHVLGHDFWLRDELDELNCTYDPETISGYSPTCLYAGCHRAVEHYRWYGFSFCEVHSRQNAELITHNSYRATVAA